MDYRASRGTNSKAGGRVEVEQLPPDDGGETRIRHQPRQRQVHGRPALHAQVHSFRLLLL